MTNFEQYAPHDDWHECTIEDACRIAALMGWDVSPKDVSFSGFWSQGDGASFTGTLGYANGCARNVRQYAPLDKTLHDIADRWQALQRRNFYGYSATLKRIGSTYEHENTVNLGYGGEIAGPTADWDAPAETDETALEIARDFMRWLHKQLETEYEFQAAWQRAVRWHDLETEAKEARETARDAVSDYRATLAAGAPAQYAKAAIREALEEMRKACETRKELASDFAYWDAGGKRFSIDEFAAEYV